MSNAVTLFVLLALQQGPGPYIPNTTIELRGSVFDTALCESPYDVDVRGDVRGCHRLQPGEEVPVVIHDIDREGRARVMWRNTVRYVPAQRLILNCAGTRASLRSFWNERQDRFDFRACR